MLRHAQIVYLTDCKGLIEINNMRDIILALLFFPLNKLNKAKEYRDNPEHRVAEEFGSVITDDCIEMVLAATLTFQHYS